MEIDVDIKERKLLVAMMFEDAIKQIQQRCQNIREKITRDGHTSFGTANLDILADSQRAWALAKEMHILNGLEEKMTKSTHQNDDTVISTSKN